MNSRVQTKPKRVKGEDQFFTTMDLAERIAIWAKLEPGMRVLEPSAGDGGLAIPLLVSAPPSVKVTCVEYDTVIAARLETKLKSMAPIFQGRYNVFAEDFMIFEPPAISPDDSHAAVQYPFDIVVMNPPYGSRENKTVGMAHRHVAHALKFAPRVIVLCAASFEHGKRADDLIFSVAHMTRSVTLKKRPRFVGPHNKGIQPQRDYKVMEFEHGAVSGSYMVETERW